MLHERVSQVITQVFTWVLALVSMEKLAKLVCSAHVSLIMTVTAERTCSTAHARQEVLAWSRPFVSLYRRPACAPPEKQRRYSCVRAVSVQSSGPGENIACLPRQPS